jgi:hypothetical protein
MLKFNDLSSIIIDFVFKDLVFLKILVLWLIKPLIEFRCRFLMLIQWVNSFFNWFSNSSILKEFPNSLRHYYETLLIIVIVLFYNLWLSNILKLIVSNFRKLIIKFLIKITTWSNLFFTQCITSLTHCLTTLCYCISSKTLR